jgi:hypothetical protein
MIFVFKHWLKIYYLLFLIRKTEIRNLFHMFGK